MSLKDKKIYYFDKVTEETNSITVAEIIMALEKITSQEGNAMKFFYTEIERDNEKNIWIKYINNLN